LVLAVLTKGLPLYGRSGLQRSSKPPEVSGGGNTGLDNGQPVRSPRRDRGCGREMVEQCHGVVPSGTEKDAVQRSEK
jgi:hypothetical protein